jgi:hypothetical protein
MAIRDPFLGRPRALGPWWTLMLRNYLSRCLDAGAVPNAELLGRIPEVLEQLQQDDSPEEDAR